MFKKIKHSKIYYSNYFILLVIDDVIWVSDDETTIITIGEEEVCAWDMTSIPFTQLSCTPDVFTGPYSTSTYLPTKKSVLVGVLGGYMYVLNATSLTGLATAVYSKVSTNFGSYSMSISAIIPSDLSESGVYVLGFQDPRAETNCCNNFYKYNLVGNYNATIVNNPINIGLRSNFDATAMSLNSIYTLFIANVGNEAVTRIGYNDTYTLGLVSWETTSGGLVKSVQVPSRVMCVVAAPICGVVFLVTTSAVHIIDPTTMTILRSLAVGGDDAYYYELRWQLVNDSANYCSIASGYQSGFNYTRKIQIVAYDPSVQVYPIDTQFNTIYNASVGGMHLSFSSTDDFAYISRNNRSVTEVSLR